jgi:hypothetical protein
MMAVPAQLAEMEIGWILRGAALCYPLVVDVGDLVFQFPERLTLTAQPGTAPEVARVCGAGSGASRAEARRDVLSEVALDRLYHRNVMGILAWWPFLVEPLERD